MEKSAISAAAIACELSTANALPQFAVTDSVDEAANAELEADDTALETADAADVAFTEPFACDALAGLEARSTTPHSPFKIDAGKLAALAALALACAGWATSAGVQRVLAKNVDSNRRYRPAT